MGGAGGEQGEVERAAVPEGLCRKHCSRQFRGVNS